MIEHGSRTFGSERPGGIFTRGVAIALIMASLACSSGDDAPPVPEPVADDGPATINRDVLVRGYVVLGPEVRSIKPCDEDLELWVIPIAELSRAYDEFSREPYAPVFVEVEGRRGPPADTGFGADYDGQLDVTALRRAAPAVEGFGCNEDVSGFEFRASGEEPFWHLRITPSAMIYSTAEIPETVFAGAEAMFSSGGWVYESQSTGPEAIRIEAGFEPGRCQDSMVGSLYSWVATVDIAGEVRSGCAWEGALAPGR